MQNRDAQEQTMRLTVSYGQMELTFEFPAGAVVDVADLLRRVQDRHPDIYRSWCTSEGELRRSLSVFINGEAMRHRDGFRTELRDGDEVRVIPTLGGG
ncbi:MAG: MoaD/ThiS family protein [Anaerolineales bacterium]|nr:MoaD/ThiS family protein [Anaerolineales bacterium]